MYEKIERLLQQKKITAYTLCKETGISTAALSGYKHGRMKPSFETLKKIADYFNVPIDYFV